MQYKTSLASSPALKGGASARQILVNCNHLKLKKVKSGSFTYYQCETPGCFQNFKVEPLEIKVSYPEKENHATKFTVPRGNS
jgi:hypothetical protein